MFRTSDRAWSGLPGALWYSKRPDWLKVAERLGEFEGYRGRFRPFAEVAQFDGAEDAFVQPAAEILGLYLWPPENHPDFDAIRVQYRLPDPDQVKTLIRELEGRRGETGGR